MKCINYKEWKELCDKLCKSIDKKKYKYVFGVPRGGCLIAQYVSEKLGLTLIEDPSFQSTNTIIVDDLIDSGRTRKKFKEFDFKVLIDKRKSKKKEWIEFWYESTEADDNNLIVRMLERIGENPQRQGLKDTPKRVIKMWKEMFRGNNPYNMPEITIFNNGKDGVNYDEMIIDKGDGHSHCEHHMVPIIFDYYFAYIPDKKIVGLSKVARLIDFFSSRLQIQERLVKDVLDVLEKKLKPKGIALIIKGRHLCKEMRGVKKKGEMITSDLRGVFKTKTEVRLEFLNLIK